MEPKDWLMDGFYLGPHCWTRAPLLNHRFLALPKHMGNMRTKRHQSWEGDDDPVTSCNYWLWLHATVYTSDLKKYRSYVNTQAIKSISRIYTSLSVQKPKAREVRHLKLNEMIWDGLILWNNQQGFWPSWCTFYFQEHESSFQICVVLRPLFFCLCRQYFDWRCGNQSTTSNCWNQSETN